MRFPRTLLALAVALTAVSGCNDSTPPKDDRVPSASLTFLEHAPDALPLAGTSVSFWAVKGEDRRGKLYYQVLTEGDTVEFVRLRVRDESLLRRPDGSLIAEGDSVLITMTLVDPVNLIVQMQPAGLRFDPREPAELKFHFGETDDDLDDDGDVDVRDLNLEAQLSIWKQESASEPWAQLVSRIELELDEIEAEITGFTNFVVAYRTARPVED